MKTKTVRFPALVALSLTLLLTLAHPSGPFAAQAACWPHISSIDPDHVTAGTRLPFFLNISGSCFAPGATVLMSEIGSRNAIFRSSTQIVVPLFPGDVARPKYVAILVRNPSGESSELYTFFYVYAFNVGISELTPSGGTSALGLPTTFTLTWTHPQRWRLLNTIDLVLRDADGTLLDARFSEGLPNSTFSLLDSQGNVVGTGMGGSNAVLESDTARLYLAESGFTGTGPDGPSVTITFTVSFKGQPTDRTANMELYATDDNGNRQGPDMAGTWTVASLQGPAGACPASIPSSVFADAIAHPEQYYGWGMCANPGLSCGPGNPYRTWLGLSNPNLRYDPIFNPPVWKAGCP